MSEQDGTKSSTKQRRSRKTGIANHENGEQARTAQCPTNNDKNAWKAYWKEQGQPWRTEPEIDAERQRYLAERRSMKPDIVQGIYPFKGIKLSRADVEWLLATHNEKTWQTGINITIRAGLDLRGADLRKIDLRRLPLFGLLGSLDAEEWFTATADQREAAAIHLEGANLTLTDLTQSQLKSAHLEGADLRNTHFEFTSLRGAHLGGKTITEECIRQDFMSEHHISRLPAANLQYTYFNAGTTLEETDLGNEQDGYIRLVDVRWGGVNLAAVNWSQVKILGNEQEAHKKETSAGEKKDKSTHLKECEVAMRANRQLANALREQGLDVDAARFAYHAELMQRKVFWYQGARSIGQYLLSLFLGLLAGYGYRPGRSVLWYLLIIFGFAFTYHFLGGLSLYPPDAFIFSIMSFHGRGFFPNLSQETNLHNPLVMFAAAEAIVGLLIEISFIATFTQRFFGK